ncbi:Oidioi.mRNA.OKI2018_I69.chr1.g135.t2.cds [Oikopleura dioica]|uniref:Kinase n=1 Tax=Oikopleura dioica TaxID=34765 RepID=A0ABN7SNF0_OIKDI|nr:Oidioi.mRNA.OKI2018_I69.chr1.g135.t2.cds [Oikopleura dioica]
MSEKSEPVDSKKAKKRGLFFKMSDLESFAGAAGHSGGILKAKNGHLLKIFHEENSNEPEFLSNLPSDDPLRPYTAEFYGIREISGSKYLELENLTEDCQSPSVMDIKLGKKTFIHDPKNNAERADLFSKMQKLDPTSLTPEELSSGTVTKSRYLQFRDDLSTTSMYGFRIEGISFSKDVESTFQKPEKIELQRMSKDSALENFGKFVDGNKLEKSEVLEKLKNLRQAVTDSSYLKNHQLIGCSLLFIADSQTLRLKLIDFAKSKKFESEEEKDDSWRTGLDNLISEIEQ